MKRPVIVDWPLVLARYPLCTLSLFAIVVQELNG